jgi:NAD+ synthase (glutamine-hydrolysing)
MSNRDIKMKSKELNVVLAQINPIVGDLEYNANKICNVIEKHQNADLIIFPEMALTGYPLMDHIHDPIVQRQNREAIEKIKRLKSQASIILGTFIESSEIKEKVHPFYNSALLIQDDEIIDNIYKRLLPDYDIFNERRYFAFGDDYKTYNIKGIQIGILICEDLWDENYDIKVAQNLVENGAELLICINASPFHIGKFEIRKNLVSSKAKQFSVPLIYLNIVGGLDEIVYDGQSFICDGEGNIIALMKAFKEDIFEYKISVESSNSGKKVQYEPNWKKNVIDALKLNLQDYFNKSNIFNGIVLGLSGGIDSAFTAYICAKAIGAEKVNAIMLPTRFTSQESIDLAKKLCEILGIKYRIHHIDALFENYRKNISDNMGPVDFDIADENLQARIRATILMYYSNKFNWLLVSTGNKSEIGVGYCTLYGDTDGGKNVPGDLFKTQIYELANWINKKMEIIPQGIIDRPPTAELRENQKDSDSIPPYEILDQILKEIIQNGIGSEMEKLLEKRVDLNTINKVKRLYLNSEYKRRQLVQTIKVSESAFGIGRRYPVLKHLRFDDLN